MNYFFFDGHCGFCKWWLQHMKPYLSEKTVIFLPLDDPLTMRRYPHLTPPLVRSAAAFVSDSGESFRAEKAIIRLLLISERHRRIGIFLGHPLVQPFAAIGYRLVAWMRPLLSRFWSA